jgi:hypothetical protein
VYSTKLTGGYLCFTLSNNATSPTIESIFIISTVVITPMMMMMTDPILLHIFGKFHTGKRNNFGTLL